MTRVLGKTGQTPLRTCRTVWRAKSGMLVRRHTRALDLAAVHGLAGWSRAVRRDIPQPANRTNMSGSTAPLRQLATVAISLSTVAVKIRNICSSVMNPIAFGEIRVSVNAKALLEEPSDG